MTVTQATGSMAMVLGLLAVGVVRSAEAEATSGDSLTVETCVALARDRAPVARAAALDRLAALHDSLSTAVNHRPRLSMLAGATIAPRGFYDPVVTNLGEYEAKLSLDWTAADGGRLARARHRSALDARAAEQRAAAEVRDVGLEAARLAFDALRLRNDVVAQQAAVEWLDRLEALVRAGVVSGTRSPSDSMRVDLARDVALTTLQSTELEARANALELAALLGRDENAFTVRENSAWADRGPTPEDSSSLIAMVDRRPEVMLAKVTASRASLDWLDAGRAGAPTIDLTLDAGLAGADLTRAVPLDFLAEHPGATLGDRLRRDLGASAAIRLRWPIADPSIGSAARARQAGSRAEMVRADAQADAARRRAMILIATWRATYKRLETARVSVERAETNLFRVKSLYVAGSVRLLDLLDAREVNEEARQRYSDARAENRRIQFEVGDQR